MVRIPVSFMTSGEFFFSPFGMMFPVGLSQTCPRLSQEKNEAQKGEETCLELDIPLL